MNSNNCHHYFVQKDQYWESCTHCGFIQPLGTAALPTEHSTLLPTPAPVAEQDLVTVLDNITLEIQDTIKACLPEEKPFSRIVGQFTPSTPPVAELPKEAEGKAKELVEKFMAKLPAMSAGEVFKMEVAKRITLICVDEVIAALIKQNPNYEANTYWSPIDFWQQVRTAINNI